MHFKTEEIDVLINDSELWVNAGDVERNMGIRNHHSYFLNGEISFELESVINVVRIFVKFVVKEVVLVVKPCAESKSD